jgi:hypothetical protein
MDRMPAAQVMMLTLVEPSSCVRPCIRLSRFSILVPTSERFLRAPRRFWTILWLRWPERVSLSCATRVANTLPSSERPSLRENTDPPTSSV